MRRPSDGGGLHACMRGFPGAALALSRTGIVLDSNGRLEAQLGQELVNRPFTAVLDSSSRKKWEQVLSRPERFPVAPWELVLEGAQTLELRTFVAMWGDDEPHETLWLIEYPRDAKLVPLYEKLAAANSELVQVHRELAKERARLTHALVYAEEARVAAERATARLRALHGITTTVIEPLTMGETAKRLLARLREALETDTATILLADPAGTVLDAFASDGLQIEIEECQRAPVGQGFAGRVALSRAPVTLDDVQNSKIESAHFRAAVRSAAGVPLLVDERLIGVLHVGTVELRRFTPEDVQLLELVARDIALEIERVRLLERERAARAEAEGAVRLRDEVLAIVAHDLRSPLGGISMAAAVIGEESLSSERRAVLIGSIQRAAGLMSRLIRDLLDAASLDAGRLRVDRQPLDVRALADEVYESFRLRAAERGVRLERGADGEVPPVLADHGRLLQVLGNLLDNAIRLTPAGGRIVIGTERAGAAVRLAVSDTGPGIPSEELPHLFDRFWQSQRSRRGSAGLGLAIARGIVDAHEGKLWAESLPGRGSTFFILLPANQNLDPPAAHEGPPV